MQGDLRPWLHRAGFGEGMDLGLKPLPTFGRRTGTQIARRRRRSQNGPKVVPRTSTREVAGRSQFGLGRVERQPDPITSPRTVRASVACPRERIKSSSAKASEAVLAPVFDVNIGEQRRGFSGREMVTLRVTIERTFGPLRRIPDQASAWTMVPRAAPVVGIEGATPHRR